MGAISITGKSMGATSLKLTAGKITKNRADYRIIP